jgi:hypothetical protein
MDNKVFEFKNIVEAKPKYYHSTMQGPASALRCEFLSCCSWGGLLSLLPFLRLTTGPHLFATTVAILRHVCTQLNPQAKPEQLKLSKTDPSTWP